MFGYAEELAMLDERSDLDEATYSQVTALLGADRTRCLLLMLRSLVTTLAELKNESLLSPAGLASIHRLKSEAGLMGLNRLSDACGAFEEPTSGLAPGAGAVRDLRCALDAALLITNELAEPSLV